MLVIRAVFVPDGEQPPRDFAAAWDALRMPATRDSVTGQITCDDAGSFFGSGIRGEWHSDENQADD